LGKTGDPAGRANIEAGGKNKKIPIVLGPINISTERKYLEDRQIEKEKKEKQEKKQHRKRKQNKKRNRKNN
jgi:hypothetical protein